MRQVLKITIIFYWFEHLYLSTIYYYYCILIIIDCFEIFLDCPTYLLARAQTFSQYKHHNTVKYLIGVTPQGSVSFISEGWGGRTNDKYLTEQCSLLTHLVPGDLVLADRGFDISDSVGPYCSTLKIPAFTKGKKHLSSIEVEQTWKIANVRIHVECLIGNIRQKYSILSCKILSTQTIRLQHWTRLCVSHVHWSICVIQLYHYD